MDQQAFLKMWHQLRRTRSVPHGVLVAGPRVVEAGATTLLASMLCERIPPCEGGVSGCGQCKTCERVLLPRSPNHYVLQKGDHRAVPLEDIRSMQKAIGFEQWTEDGLPFVVVVPDVAHVSIAGWNVMLKVLEEPPPHVVFVMFGTLIRQLPMTVRSRVAVFFISDGMVQDSPDALSETTVEASRVLTVKGVLDFWNAKKPGDNQAWQPWCQQLVWAMRSAIARGAWEMATRIGGALLEVMDAMGRRRHDGSVNLKYEISSIVARYESR